MNSQHINTRTIGGGRRRRTYLIAGAVLTAGVTTSALILVAAESHAAAARRVAARTTERPTTSTSTTGNPGSVKGADEQPLPPTRPRSSSASSATPSTAPTSTTPPGPPRYDELPGYGQSVTTDEVTLIHRSMVHVESGWKDADKTVWWSDECTGTKITLSGRVFVLTAAHCLGLPDDDYYGGGKARNVTKKVILGVNLSSLVPSTGPTIPARTVIESQSTDAALLQIDEHAPHASVFDALPSLPYDTLLMGANELAGQATMSSSLEEMASSRIDGPGIYLGRAVTPNGYALDDWIGLDRHDSTDIPERDPCFYGGSGSIAVLADGHVTGPLSWRQRTSYYRGYSSPAGNDQPLDEARSYMHDADAELGIAPAPFRTYCGYASLSTSQLGELVRLMPSQPVLTPSTPPATPTASPGTSPRTSPVSSPTTALPTPTTGSTPPASPSR